MAFETLPDPLQRYTVINRLIAFIAASKLTVAFTFALLYAAFHRDPWDFADVLARYREDAENGITSAQVELGELYEKGQGVVQDYVEAEA